MFDLVGWILFGVVLGMTEPATVLFCGPVLVVLFVVLTDAGRC
jgi:hypothetical protein